VTGVQTCALPIFFNFTMKQLVYLATSLCWSTE